MLGLSEHHTRVYLMNPAFIVDLDILFQQFVKLFRYYYKYLLNPLDKSIFLTYSTFCLLPGLAEAYQNTRQVTKSQHERSACVCGKAEPVQPGELQIDLHMILKN